MHAEREQVDFQREQNNLRAEIARRHTPERLTPAHIDRERKRDAMPAHRSGTTGPTGPTGPASTTSERIGNYVVNYNYGTHRVALAHVVDNEFQHPVERAPHPQEWPSQEEGKRRTRYTGPK